MSAGLTLAQAFKSRDSVEGDMHVSREATALITLHGGSDTTACDEASDEFERILESLTEDGQLDDAEVVDTEIDEHPAAPFDPYTVAVSFRVGVNVDSGNPEEASDRGAELIDEALADAGIGDSSYTSPPTAST
jgi:hypothetical protein